MKAEISNLPQGWFSPADIEWYREIYRDCLPVSGQAVEVGCYLGRSLCAVGDIILERGIYVFCIDTFQGVVGQPADNLHGRFRENVENYGLEGSVMVLKQDSLFAAKTLNDSVMDFVFLDGDHSYETVKAELQAFERKIRKGGYIGGHDYFSFPGVVQAVNERYGQDVQVRMDSTIWLHRVGEL